MNFPSYEHCQQLCINYRQTSTVIPRADQIAKVHCRLKLKGENPCGCLHNLKLCMNTQTKLCVQRGWLCELCFTVTASKFDRTDAFHSFDILEYFPAAHIWESPLHRVFTYISLETSRPGCHNWPALALRPMVHGRPLTYKPCNERADFHKTCSTPRPDCRGPQAVLEWLAGAFLFRSGSGHWKMFYWP